MSKFTKLFMDELWIVPIFKQLVPLYHTTFPIQITTYLLYCVMKASIFQHNQRVENVNNKFIF